MPKIVLTAGSAYATRFQPTSTVDVDDEEWDQMGPDDRALYCHDLADSFRLEVVQVDWEVQ